MGYVVSGRKSVEEVIVLTGNKPRGGKNNSCGGHPQEENGESSSSGLLSYLGIFGLLISHLGHVILRAGIRATASRRLFTSHPKG